MRAAVVVEEVGVVAVAADMVEDAEVADMAEEVADMEEEVVDMAVIAEVAVDMEVVVMEAVVMEAADTEAVVVDMEVCYFLFGLFINWCNFK